MTQEPDILTSQDLPSATYKVANIVSSSAPINTAVLPTHTRTTVTTSTTGTITLRYAPCEQPRPQEKTSR